MVRKLKPYYVPKPSHWPIVGSLALFCMMLGLANWLHGNGVGPYLFVSGLLLLLFMMYGWFGVVIKESRMGLLRDPRVDRSFRWSMGWFIFTEVMFFGAFFGVLFYVRQFSVPWLGGSGTGMMTHELLWPAFQAQWPLFVNPDPSLYPGPASVINTWGLPAIGTGILLSSGVTVTVAHWGVLENNRRVMFWFQLATIVLGLSFLCLQADEYTIAYLEKGLTLGSGIYGSTFFLLTGFHALHVVVGVVMLSVILWRMHKGDFTPKDHFGFAAVSWYWHFVDIVWLMLFVFVYWL